MTCEIFGYYGSCLDNWQVIDLVLVGITMFICIIIIKSIMKIYFWKRGWKYNDKTKI